MAKKRTPAVAYFRTSSATNVDGDSLPRQKEAVERYARSAGYKIASEFYDAAVSGADPIDQRPGFIDLLEATSNGGPKIVLVENASRFARDLAVQIAGHKLLKERGIELIPADAPDHFTDETPTAVMVRQILGAVSQFEKAGLVARLRKARERKARETGERVGGYEADQAAIERARKLRRKDRSTGRRMSFGKIARQLEAEGYRNRQSKAYTRQAVALWCEGLG